MHIIFRLGWTQLTHTPHLAALHPSQLRHRLLLILRGFFLFGAIKTVWLEARCPKCYLVRGGNLLTLSVKKGTGIHITVLNIHKKF